MSEPLGHPHTTHTTQTSAEDRARLVEAVGRSVLWRLEWQDEEQNHAALYPKWQPKEGAAMAFGLIKRGTGWAAYDHAGRTVLAMEDPVELLMQLGPPR